MGVADIAAVRFSLPAQLLEPTPNLGTQLPDPSESFLSSGLVQFEDRYEALPTDLPEEDEIDYLNGLILVFHALFNQ